MTEHGGDGSAIEVIARTDDELVDAVEDADAAGVSVALVDIDGPAPEGTVGRVVRTGTTGITVDEAGCSVDSLAFCGGVGVTAAAGEDWNTFVAHAVEREWVGVEALAGPHGSVGRVAVSNLRRHGQSVGTPAVPAVARGRDRSGDARAEARGSWVRATILRRPTSPPFGRIAAVPTAAPVTSARPWDGLRQAPATSCG